VIGRSDQGPPHVIGGLRFLTADAWIERDR
jgi:hypothetical protein